MSRSGVMETGAGTGNWTGQRSYSRDGTPSPAPSLSACNGGPVTHRARADSNGLFEPILDYPDDDAHRRYADLVAVKTRLCEGNHNPTRAQSAHRMESPPPWRDRARRGRPPRPAARLHPRRRCRHREDRARRDLPVCPPNAAQREAIIRNYTADADITALVKLTGPNNGASGFTYSDLTQWQVPAAALTAFPHAPLTGAALLAAAPETRPTPPFREDNLAADSAHDLQLSPRTP